MNSGINQVIETYKTSVFAKDVDSLMRLYDERVMIFDAWDTWTYEGAVAWRKSVERWFSSLETGKVRVNLTDVQTTVGQELAVVNAIVTYTGVSPEGKDIHSLQNRITWVLRLNGADWKIIHEHTSVPVDFDSSKAIFQRKKDP